MVHCLIAMLAGEADSGVCLPHSRHGVHGCPGLQVVKNRRLAAMQQLQGEGFFSDEEMRRRAPLLYNQLVGQYLGDAHPLHPASQVVAPSNGAGSAGGALPGAEGVQGAETAAAAAAAAGRKFSTFLMQVSEPGMVGSASVPTTRTNSAVLP